MAAADAIRKTVQAYVDAVGAADPDAILALYADNGTVEDPVGSRVRVGREEVAAFYARSAGYANRTELLACRISGDSAAFHFRITTTLPDKTIEIEPIDVMVFDEDAKIVQMRAFWAPEDYRTL